MCKRDRPMAENKKSFILYADIIHTFRELTDVEAGQLIKHVLAYVNDEDPQTDDKLIKIAFEPIKQQLKRDLRHWEGIKEKRVLAGQVSAEKKKQRSANSTHVDTCQQEPTLSTVNDTVNVNGNVNVNFKESSGNELLKSNLYRQPKVPTFEQVHQAFAQQGGTEEMAKVFFEKNSSTGWFLSGSPIVNFSSLIPKFITNWKTNTNAINKRPVTDHAHPDADRTW